MVIPKSVRWSAIAMVAGTLSAGASSWLSEYHLIVSGELTRVSEVEGRAVINNLAYRNSFNVGVNYKSDPDQINLAIQGDIAAGNPLQLNAGSLHVAGKAEQKGNQVILPGGRMLNLNGGGNLFPEAKFDFDSVFKGLESESTAYAALGANSTLSLPAGQPGPATFNVDKGLGTGEAAVFNLSAADAKALFDSSLVQQIDLNLNGTAPSAVLINVAGSAISYIAGGNFVGNFISTSASGKVLWNFADAQSIEMNKSFYGSVLAPNATLSSTGGALEGSVAVRNLSADVEVHAPLFSGTIATVAVVPEGSTYAAGIAVLGLLGWLRFRRG